MPKQKFKRGVGAVPDRTGWWDINYQVNGKRVPKRMEFFIKDAKGNYDAKASREAAETWRLDQKSKLRQVKEGTSKGESIFDLNEALKRITVKIKGEIERGERCKTALSEVIPPAQRFFFDYPKYLGKNWTTTADITPDDLERYKAYYRDVLKKPNGLSTEIGKIQNILTHFKKEKIITPQRLVEFREVRRPGKNVRRLIRNSESDFVKVLRRIKDEKPRLFEFLSFIGNTARRPREVRKYLRENAKVEHNYIDVPAEITKNKKPSKIHLDTELKKDVERAASFSRKLNSEYLFLNDSGRPFSANNPQLNFQKAARECGIPNWKEWCVYQLKKRFITICRSKGLSAEAISQVSGHVDLESVMENYSFPDEDQSNKVLQAGRLRV